MTPGRISAPRVRVADALRIAIRSTAAHGRTIRQLATRATFPSADLLSAQLHAAHFPATPLNRGRWELLAATLRYDGPAGTPDEAAHEPQRRHGRLIDRAPPLARRGGLRPVAVAQG